MAALAFGSAPFVFLVREKCIGPSPGVAHVASDSASSG
jgi:hypothetical protein